MAKLIAAPEVPYPTPAEISPVGFSSTETTRFTFSDFFESSTSIFIFLKIPKDFRESVDLFKFVELL